MQFFDSHCHLEHEQFAGDIEAVVERAKAAGVAKAVAAGSSPQANEAVMEFKKCFPDFISPVLGISPHDASQITKNKLVEELAKIKKLAESRQIVGLGEVGLDRHWFKERSDWDAQEHVFREQLVIAEKAGLPVVVHTRKAEEAVFEVLEDYSKLKVVLHCFLNTELAKKASGRGWMVSLPTIKSGSFQKIAEKLPLERLFCETDSPFLWKNEAGIAERNEPKNVVWAYQRVAQYKKKTVEEVAAQLWKNGEKFFGFEKV